MTWNDGPSGIWAWRLYTCVCRAVQKECEERRTKAKIMDRLRVKNAKLSDIEQEQRLQNDDLQRKAMIQLQENEEEIKRLNQVENLIK